MPRAAGFKGAVASVRLWRAVEAQHVVSTRRLVDDLDEQKTLEDILETTKPAVPPPAGRLHYLLFTPFRYPSPRGSRFRAVDDPGVFYGAESVRTACAELGYWRWRFLMDSPGLAALGPAQQTLFQASARTRSVDLQRPPYVRNARRWTDPVDYRATQAFGRAAREAGIGLIRYRSVRDPEPGRCGALLTPGAFSSPDLTAPAQTWLLTVTRDYATWQRAGESFEFGMRRWQ